MDAGTNRKLNMGHANLSLTALAMMCAVGLGVGQVMAADFTWTGAGSDSNWSTAANWEVNGGTATVAPGSSDRVTFDQTTGGSVIVDADTGVYGITFDTDAGAYTIDGSHALTAFNITVNSSSNSSLVTFNTKVIQHGTPSWTIASGETLLLKGGLVGHSNNRILMRGSGTLDIDSAVSTDSTGPAYFSFRGDPTLKLEQASTGPIIIRDDYATHHGVAYLNAENAMGVSGSRVWLEGSGTVYANHENAINGETTYVSVGTGYRSGYTSLMTMNDGQGYEGATTIGNTVTGQTADNAILLANNASGSATGNSDITVNIGTLGGDGFITNTDASTYQGGTDEARGVTVAAGGVISPGVAVTAGSIGTLTMNLGSKGLDISGADTAANSQSLLFDLATPGSSDRIALTGGVLHIGTDALGLGDFAFNTTGILSGTYILFATDQAIDGTLGSNLTGLIGGSGQTGTLSLANGKKDIVLTIGMVPEPASAALLLLGLGGLLMLPGRKKGVKASEDGCV